MRFGFVLPGGTVAEQVELATLADGSGWDAVFTYEAAYSIDPWSLLSAMAMRTQRVKLGTMLTPLPWRHPWKLASQVATLDHISNGRAILTVGMGATDAALGVIGTQAQDVRERAQLLDEGLGVITALWEGDGKYHGERYQVDMSSADALGERLRPVQQPRVPIWVVGVWPKPKSMRRVINYDAIVPNIVTDTPGPGQGAPKDIAAMVEWLDANGRRPGFDVIWEGQTPADNPEQATDIVRPWADAGATWWLEARWMPFEGDKNPETALRDRIAAGPPSV